MVQDTGKFTEQSSDVLGAIRNLDVQELLNGQGEALLVGHHGDVVESVEVGKSLEIGLVLDQLLSASVEQTDVGIGSNDLLAIEFQNQSQHTVGSGMLRTKVDGVVANLAVGNRVLARLSDVLCEVWVGEAVGIGRVRKILIDGHEPGADGLGRGISSQVRRGEGSGGGGEGCWSKTESLGTSASESVEGGHCEWSKSGEVARKQWGDEESLPAEPLCSRSMANG